MRITYDREADALAVRFKEITVTTRHFVEGIAADYDASWLALRSLDAVRRLGDPAVFERVILDGAACARVEGAIGRPRREITGNRSMKVTYDARTETLTVLLKETAVAESDEDKRGVILDYDERGDLVSIEVLDASRRVTDTRRVECQRQE